MTTEKKERAKRTPRNYENILKGAMSLQLEDQVKLVKALKENISSAVSAADENARILASLANGLG